MSRSSMKAAVLAAALLLGALIPALAQQRGPGLVGDVNGDGRITSADALAVYAYLAGRPIPATYDVPGRGDADGDGQITRADAELIMRVAVGQPAGDRPVGKPATPGTAPAEGPLRLQCVADVRAGSVRCSAPPAATPQGMRGDRVIYGGQHVFVSVLTTDALMQADTFSFDVRVKNLLEQPIGTSDGTSVDPVKVFFAAGIQNTTTPANNGVVVSVNHDGEEAFTTSEPQKFFAYNEIVEPQATSSARRWKLRLDPGVQSFTFSLYVSSPVVSARGYVDVYPDSAQISAGATLQLSDTVRSALGRPIPGATVTWSSSNTAVATVSANGIVTAVADGTVEITASNAPRTPGKMKLVVLTPSADSSTFTASPGSLPVRDTSIVTLQLRSANGTPLTRSAGTVILGASAGSLSVTDNNNGTYTAILTSSAVGLVEVIGTLNGVALRDTARVTFTAGAATGYVVTSSASTVAAGSPVTITAQTVDADSNPVAAEGTVINWTSTNGGSFASATSVTDSAGAATVDFTTSTTAGVTHTVTATDSLSRTGTSGSITTQVGVAAKLAIVQQPTNTTAGAAISPAVTVAVQDANGNLVTGATDNVVASIGSNAASGTLSGTKSVAPVNGIATFSNLSIDKAGTGYTLAFSGTALEPDTSSTFDVTPGAAAKLVLLTQPSETAQSGAAFTRQPVVQLQDVNGNAVAQAGVGVTAAIATGGGTLGGTATINTDASGTATFTDLAISGTVGDRTLSFSATNLTGVSSGTVSVTAGAASQLAITTQPSSSTQNGAAFAQQPVIQLRDASGNAVAQAGVEVTVAIASGGGTLGGTATVNTDANGTATFAGLSITGTVGDRTLSFSATGLTGATSGTISVTAGAAAQLGITTQPSSSAQNGATFAQQPVVQLQDASGNAVAQAGVEVTAAIATGGGTLGGTATVNTDANGTATFTGLSITGTVGDRTLSFSATGLTGATSGTISVTAGAASQLVITTQPSSTAQAGAAFAQQPVVQLQDASGNAVAQAGVEVTAAIASGGGTLGGTA
ncbi:MAG TPA: invasin domain 3-containing protein, partial [Longimicrobium sp.]|nr:invasin domain 3-containing protein [Longimicrobium sp.]